MIPIEKHDSVVRQSGIAEFRQHFARLTVHRGDVIVILGPVPADLRDIRMIGGQRGFGGI